MCMRSYAGSAPSRAAGRVTSASHLSLQLERTCCIVLDFLSLPSFVFTFLSVSAIQTPPCLKQSSHLWENRLRWSLEDEFTSGVSGNGRNYLRSEERDRRFSLLRGKSSFLQAINPRSPLRWERRDASKIERVRYKERTLAVFYFSSVTSTLMCVKCAVVSRAIKWLKQAHSSSSKSLA